MTTAAIYCRISEDKAGDAHGVDDQEARCRRIAIERRLKRPELYVDNDLSAFSGKARPEWTRMLGDLASGRVATVIAFANDRLYRRTRDQLDLMEAVQRAGGKIVTVLEGETDPASAEGRMRMGILANVAEFESARKAERVKARIETNAAEGKPHGRPGYGWTLEGSEWVLNPAEAANVTEAAKRILAGETCHEIVRDWNLRGITTQTGKPWFHQTLRKILRSPATAGLRATHGQIVAAGTWPALLDRETWDQVAAALAPRRNYSNRAPRRYLLSGLVYCSTHGERMTGHSGAFKAYECRGTGCGRRINRDRLDAFITEATFQVLETPELAERLRQAEGDDVSLAITRFADAERRMEEMARIFAAGEMSRAEWQAAREVAATKLTDAERHLAEHRGAETLTDVMDAPVRDQWEHRPLRWRRDVVNLIIERIDVRPADVPGRHWEPERISVTWRT